MVPFPTAHCHGPEAFSYPGPARLRQRLSTARLSAGSPYSENPGFGRASRETYHPIKLIIPTRPIERCVQP